MQSQSAQKVADDKIKQREQIISKEMEQVKRKEAEVDSMKETVTAQLEIVNKNIAIAVIAPVNMRIHLGGSSPNLVGIRSGK